MSKIPPATAESKSTDRRFLRWRRVLLGIASLSVVFGLALCIWVSRLPPFWWLDHDWARYARISKAIAADPRHFQGRRLSDFIRELDLEDIPWDNVMDQSETGSGRIYHFRGFRLLVGLYVPPEYYKRGFGRILREEGSREENREARDLIRISYGPYVLIDGINSREERMRKYEADFRASIDSPP